MPKKRGLRDGVSFNFDGETICDDMIYQRLRAESLCHGYGGWSPVGLYKI